MGSSPALDVRGLSCAVGGRVLLRDVVLTARSGESLAVMGPSGSGKSTLLACLAGLLPATAGTVRVCGTDVGALRAGKAAAWRLRTIGFVYQFGELLPELSAVENAALPLLTCGPVHPSLGPARRLTAARPRTRPPSLDGHIPERERRITVTIASRSVRKRLPTTRAF